MDYKFKNKEEQKKALVEFMNDMAEGRRIDYAKGDGVSGYDSVLHDMFQGHAKIDSPFEHGGDDEFLELMEQAKKAGLPDKVILNLLRDTADIDVEENYGIPDNCLAIMTIEEEEDQVSGVSGNVNGKQTDDIFDALREGLDEEDIKEVGRNLEHSYWNGKSDYQSVRGPFSYRLIANLEKFTEEINKLFGKQGKKKKAKSELTIEDAVEGIKAYVSDCVTAENYKVSLEDMIKTVSEVTGLSNEVLAAHLSIADSKLMLLRK